MDKDKILILSRYLGLFPFSADGQFSPRLSFYSFTWISFAVLSYLATYVCFYHLFALSGYPTGFLLSILDVFQAVTGLSGYVVHYGLTLKNRREISGVIQFFARAKPRKSHELLLLIIGIILLFTSTLASLEGECDSMLCLLIFSTDLGLTIQFVILLQFSSIVQYLKAGFASIKCTTDVDSHEQLVTLGELINSLYGWQLLIFLLNLVASFIIEAFELVDAVHRSADSTGHNGLQILCGGLMIVFHLMELIYMCDVCSSTSSEAEAFNDELFRMMRTNERLCNNKKMHLYVTMKQNVEFTACGFFRIGYPLVTSIIAAITTYLVIIIQFSLPNSSHQ